MCAEQLRKIGIEIILDYIVNIHIVIWGILFCRTQGVTAANFISDDEDAHHSSDNAAATDKNDELNSRAKSPAAEQRPVERASMFVCMFIV